MILQLIDIELRTVSVLVGIAFAVGFVAGFWVRSRHVESDKDDWALFVVGVIVMMWAVSMAVGLTTDHSTSVYVHILMGAAVGYIFGSDNPIKMLLPAIDKIDIDAGSNESGAADAGTGTDGADDTADDGDEHR